ncbi:DUF1090 domain-containing protein [Limnobaculum zhutongyuii]|uniref:DUF1090 domain-containing protein n=1 Tax=Limnobaculum zhutongyuii TaxID=2498113 RepID=A0A411WJL6_9GAMM|nr:DUF1090 domain-containing protein [Limnobaculum zhutongyuii]QBH96360.1 DUF1090 domain-containing protein [Limnobaculum zhutongyuii]TQS86656.1 DUF1090 domain-containing protein [Limnobaculum zhutongyuii]
MKKIKLLVLPLTLTLGVGFASMASAAGNDCNAKRVTIENQITIAQQHGNTHELAGLQKALSELNAHCTNSGLVEKAQKKVSKLEKKIREKQADVQELQADLTEAQSRGKTDKIAKYERKIAEKNADIKDITNELNLVQAELAALKS